MADKDTAVVLLNMGGPRTNAEVKDFLHRLFMDPILMKMPMSSVLQPFFAWLITTLRHKEAAERYQLIGGASPIYESTQAQTEALKTELKSRGREFDCWFCFNYSDPFPAEVLKQVAAAGKKNVLPVSLYPHYSKATTGSNLYYLEKERDQNFPDLKFLDTAPYFLHEGYVEAFIDRILEQVGPGESLDEYDLVFSAHGLPKYFLMEDDPYPFQIAQTAAAILTRLNRTKRWVISYQSAVGPLKWLEPSTEQVLTDKAKEGVKKLIVVPISFVTDHIETLCEIDIEYRKLAEDAGIKDFRMSKAVECHPGFIRALADSVEEVLPRLTSGETSGRVLMS